MKTNDFLDLLAKDQMVQKLPSLGFYYGIAALGLMAYTIYLYLSSGMGIRPDYGVHIGHILVALKQVLPLLMAFATLPILRNLLYPDTKWQAKMWVPIGGYLLVMIGLFIWAWLSTEPEARMMALMGKSHIKCMMTIPIYSWFVMGISLIAMRKYAPIYPLRSTILAAFLAAGIGTAIYAFGCDEDSPLFYALWYNLAIGVAVLVGGFVGYRFMKW